MPESTLWNRRFGFLLLAQTGFGFAHSAFMMLPKFMTTELAAGPDAIGGVVSVSAISIGLFLIPAGAMVDAHGRKRFLVTGAALMSLTSASYVLVDSVGPLLYALRILQSLGFAYAFAAGAALCIDTAPPRQIGQAIGLFGLSYVVMGAFAPAAVETIVDHRSWQAAFLAAAAAAGFCAVLSIFVREEPLESENSTRASLLEVTRSPGMLRSMTVVALLGVAFGCAFNFYQPFALSLGMETLRDFFIANSLAAAASRLSFGPFIDRIGLRRVSLVSLAFYAVVIYSMTRLELFGLVVLGLGMGLAHGIFYPAYTAIVLVDCPAEERGRRMALNQAGFNAGVGLGAVVLGLIAARWGYPVIFQISTAALVAAGMLILVERRPGRHPARASAGSGYTRSGRRSRSGSRRTPRPAGIDTPCAQADVPSRQPVVNTPNAVAILSLRTSANRAASARPDPTVSRAPLYKAHRASGT